MTATRTASLAWAVLALTVLSGCTPPASTPSSTPTAAPSVSPTPTPTVTPTAAAPVASSITVTADSIIVFDSGSTVIVEIPFSTPGDTAAAQLGTALGAIPTTTTETGGSCRRAGTIYDFGGLELDGAGTITMAPSGAFTVRLFSSATGGGVALEGPAGVQIGDSEASVLAAVPSAIPTGDGFGNSYVNLDSLGGEGGPDEVGMLGVVTGGALAQMVTPVYIFGDC